MAGLEMFHAILAYLRCVLSLGLLNEKQVPYQADHKVSNQLPVFLSTIEKVTIC